MTKIRYPQLIQSLPATVPFVGPETLERQMGKPFAARIGANENGFGPSPMAIRAMQAATGDLWMYGDPTSFDLRAALSEHLGCGPENLVVGEGIDALLGYLVRLTVEFGDAVVTSNGAYPTFNYHVAGFGGTLHKIPYKDDKEDLPALIAKAREIDAKLIYFANPDNPMGSWLTGREITAALTELPEDTLLILDEAYIECGPPEAQTDLPWDDPRLIRFRTFSKAYGLAGARIGYGIAAPDLIQNFDKIRNHFGLNRVSQIGALAALQDQEWLIQTQSKIARSKTKIAQIATDNGLTALPSATNFMAVDCGHDVKFAQALLVELGNRGIFIRMPGVAPQNRCIRISCGPDAEIDLLAATLPSALHVINEAY